MTESVSGGETEYPAFVSGGKMESSESVSGGETEYPAFVTGGKMESSESMSDGKTEYPAFGSGGKMEFSESMSGGKMEYPTFVSGGKTEYPAFVGGGKTECSDLNCSGAEMSTDYPEFPWESQYQYGCRVYKIKQFTESLGELRATALANVWANFHFLGCSYPEPVLEVIRSWEPPPKNKELEEKLAELQKQEQEAMYDKTLVNKSLKLKDLNFRMYSSAFEYQPPAVVLFYNSCQACKVPCLFEEKEGVRDGLRTVSLFINDIHVSDGKAASVKEAKHACAENALKFLKKKGLVVISPQNIEENAVGQVSKQSLTDKRGNSEECYENNKIAEDNVGCKLLKAMGWSGDTGLGKDGQGRVNPISTAGQLNRGGLGSLNSEAGICHQSVKQQLLDFLRNPDLMKLEFSSELDNLERKMIHGLSAKYGLKHKSRGSGASRRLVVWKEETSVSEILAEPVVQFEEDEEDGPDVQMREEDPELEDFPATRDNLHSLSLDPGDGSEVFFSAGKRKMPTSSLQSKVSRTSNIHFDYNSVNSNSNPQRRLGKPPGRGKRGGSRSGEHSGNNNVRNSKQQTRNRSAGPFREGYVDPYLAHADRTVYEDERWRTTYRRQEERTTYRRPDFNQSRSDHNVQGYVGDHSAREHSARSRDPRTNQSSGFGIYRHMKPRRFR